ncbi:MAG: recombinase family protein [Candidatus Thermoplasmatota archaeon]
MKSAIYVRVSTEGQSYEQQVDPCISLCENKGWDYDIYTEVASSVSFREVFEEVKRRARTGEYKTIVVFRLDRAWRNVRQFIMDFDELTGRGVSIVSVMENIDPTTTMGEFVAKVFVALAELERKLISEATKQRLEAKKRLIEKQGFYITKDGTKSTALGRPKGAKDKIRGARPKGGYYRGWEKRKRRKNVDKTQPNRT